MAVLPMGKSLRVRDMEVVMSFSFRIVQQGLFAAWLKALEVRTSSPRALFFLPFQGALCLGPLLQSARIVVRPRAFTAEQTAYGAGVRCLLSRSTIKVHQRLDFGYATSTPPPLYLSDTVCHKMGYGQREWTIRWYGYLVGSEFPI